MENYQAAKFCSNCGAALDASSAFCSNCGAKQNVEQPQYQEPQYQEPQYQQPQYQQPQYQQPQYQQPQYQYQQPQYESYQTSEISTKTKVFGIVGFASAMFAFVFGLINFFYSCSLIDTSWRYEDEVVSCFIYSFFLIAFAIVGIIFSNNSRNDGNESALTKLGKIFGIIAIPFIALSSFFMILELGGAF